MFCDEPILKTYRMCDNRHDPDLWEEPDYGCCPMAYHALPGYWLVLRTKHSFITVGKDGVRINSTMKELIGDDRTIWNEMILSEKELEELVFPGEHIQSVEKTENGWHVRFDHFEMVVVPHEEGDGFDGSRYPVDKPFYGLDHLINPCPCGGKPLFIMDDRGDFSVECVACHRSTQADYDIKRVLTEWNEDISRR